MGTIPSRHPVGGGGEGGGIGGGEGVVCGGGGEGGGIGGGEGVVRDGFWQHTSTLSPHMGPGTSGMQHLVMVAVSGANSCPSGQAHWLEPPGVINSLSLHVGGGGGLGGGSEGVGGGGSGGDGGGGGGGEGGGEKSTQHTSEAQVVP